VSSPTTLRSTAGLRKTGSQSGMSPSYRNYCQPATGTASATCRPGTGTTVSSIYRDRTMTSRLEGSFISGITGENLALTCVLRFARIRGSPSVFALAVTQLVTQPLIPCHIAWASTAGRGGSREGVPLSLTRKCQPR
jgi:hypothetical protein